MYHYCDICNNFHIFYQQELLLEFGSLGQGNQTCFSSLVLFSKKGGKSISHRVK